MSINTMTRQLY